MSTSASDESVSSPPPPVTDGQSISSKSSTVEDPLSTSSGDANLEANQLPNNLPDNDSADDLTTTESTTDSFHVGTMIIARNGPYFIIGKIDEVLAHRNRVIYKIIVKDSDVIKFVPHHDCLIYSVYTEFQFIQARAVHLANMSLQTSEHEDDSLAVDSTQNVQLDRGQLTFRRLQYLAQQQVAAALSPLNSNTRSASSHDLASHDTSSSSEMRTARNRTSNSESRSASESLVPNTTSTAVSPEINGNYRPARSPQPVAASRGIMSVQGNNSVVDNMYVNVPGRLDINQNLSTSFNPVGSSTPVDNGNRTITIDRSPIEVQGPDFSVDQSVEPEHEKTVGVNRAATGIQFMSLGPEDDDGSFRGMFDKNYGAMSFIYGSVPIGFVLNNFEFVVLPMYDRKFGLVINSFRASDRLTAEQIYSARFYDKLGAPIVCRKIVNFMQGVPQFNDVGARTTGSGPELSLMASFKLSNTGVIRTIITGREVVFLPQGTNPAVVIQLFGGDHVVPGFAGAFSSDDVKTAHVAFVKVIRRLLEASAAGAPVELADPLWLGSPLD